MKADGLCVAEKFVMGTPDRVAASTVRTRYPSFLPFIPLLAEMARYGLVGLVAFLVDFAVLILLTRVVGMYYLLSAAFGFALGLLVNYLLSIKWVFVSRAMGDRRIEFLIFAAVGVAGLGITEAVLWLGTNGMGPVALVRPRPKSRC